MKVIAAVIAMAIAITAHAEFKDGNTLLNEMNDSSPMQRGHALGYVMGVADSHRGVTHCGPANVTAGQVFDMVKGFLERYPQIRDKTADFLISTLLEQAWPCPKRPQRGSPA